MAPKRAWKLFRVLSDGSLRSLFIDRTRPLKENTWMQAKVKATKGYAFRPGWHACGQSYAPHLSTRGRVWREVELRGSITQIDRPFDQGGTWYVATSMRILPRRLDDGA